MSYTLFKSEVDIKKLSTEHLKEAMENMTKEIEELEKRWYRYYKELAQRSE